MDHIELENEHIAKSLNSEDRDTRIGEWEAQKARIASAVNVEKNRFAETVAAYGAKRFVPRGVSGRQALANRLQVLSTTSVLLFDYDGYGDSPEGLRSLLEETRDRMYDVLTAMPEAVIALNKNDERTSFSLLFLSNWRIGDWGQVVIDQALYTPKAPDAFHLIEYLLQERFLQEERAKRYAQYVAMSEGNLPDAEEADVYESSCGIKEESAADEGDHRRVSDSEIEPLDALAIKCTYNALVKCDEALAGEIDIENGRASIDEINNEVAAFFEIFHDRTGL